LDFHDLKKRASRVLGYPPDEEKWQSHQHENVNEVINDGLRQYYHPPPIDAFGQHSWTFLNPTNEMTTSDNVRWYVLPADFGYMNKEGSIAYLDTNSTYAPIQLVSESYLRKLEYQDTYTSYPIFAAVRPKFSDGVTGQRFEVGFHPTPNGEYRLGYQYFAAQNGLDCDNKFPLGGPIHAQGILKSILAAAEEFKNDQRGRYYEAFIEQLKADIAMDARRGPATLGYNSNGGSRRINRVRDSTKVFSRSVTYNGASYTG
jgi:hypothetical protein